MVTSHVQALEKRLGIQLLNRTTRKVSVTEAGRAFYERCTQILAEVEEAETAASDLHSTARGTVRVNTSVALARLVTPLIADYVTSYPDVSFELIMTDRMVDLVEEGFDLALRTGPLPDSTLIARRLGLGRKILCASPDYLTRHGTPQHPADLAEHNCLTYVNSFLDHHWHFAALAGLGICLMPSMSIGADVAAGRLVRLLPGFRTTEALIQAVYPASRHLSLKVRTFLDFLVERLACEEEALSTARPVLLNGKSHGIAAQAATLRQGRA